MIVVWKRGRKRERDREIERERDREIERERQREKADKVKVWMIVV